MITIRDVAKESGCSITTVSIVLNDAPQSLFISEETKRRIRKVAEKLEYQPNHFARSLRSRRSNSVAVMIFDITDPYCTQILRGIEDTLDQRGYVPIVIDIRNDRSRCKRNAARLLNGRIEGLITLANSVSMDLGLLQVFNEHKIPSVVIGRPCEPGSFNSVAVDNSAGGRLGLEHLYSLGHRNVAFVKGPKRLIDSSMRWEGIQAFAQQAGIEIASELVVELREPSSTFEEGYQAIEKLLKRKRKFTAVMAFDDMTAFGVVRALHVAGLQVPSDCSVLGFDDISAAAFYNPPLSTIRQPMELMGSLAVDVVLEQSANGQDKRVWSEVHRVITPDVVIRDSTRKL